MKKKVTIDVKPPMVITLGVRPCTRNMVGSAISNSQTLTAHPATAVQGPPITVQYQFMSPWGPGPAGAPRGLGQFQYPLLQQTMPSYASSLLLQHQSLTPPLASNESHAPSPFNPATLAPGMALMPANSDVEIPEIIPWFNSLDQHMKRLPYDINFMDLALELDKKAFIQISQISCNYMSIQPLQGFVGDQDGNSDPHPSICRHRFASSTCLSVNSCLLVLQYTSFSVHEITTDQPTSK